MSKISNWSPGEFLSSRQGLMIWKNWCLLRGEPRTVLCIDTCGPFLLFCGDDLMPGSEYHGKHEYFKYEDYLNLIKLKNEYCSIQILTAR